MTTRDGVEIDPLGEYWRIPVFEEYDFSGIHKGKLPQHQARNASFRVVGSDLMDGQMYESAERFASTKHLANYYGFSEWLSAFEDWFLVADMIFTVSAAAFTVIGLIRLIED